MALDELTLRLADLNEPGVIRRRAAMVSCHGNQFIWSQTSLAGDLRRFFVFFKRAVVVRIPAV